MKMSKILSLVLSFLLVAFFAGTTVAKDIKIGVMDVQTIVVECNAGQKAKQRFEVKMKQLQNKFKAEEDELKKLQDEIKKKSSAWSEEKKADKIRDFQKKGRELQTKTEEARFEMKQMQDKELEPILKALEQVVNKYGADNKFTAILDAKNSVIYFDKSVDISAAITKKLNAAMGGK